LVLAAAMLIQYSLEDVQKQPVFVGLAMELTDVYVRKVDEQVVVYVLQMVTAAATAAIEQ
jgi:hypothetical protein